MEVNEAYAKLRRPYQRRVACVLLLFWPFIPFTAAQDSSHVAYRAGVEAFNARDLISAQQLFETIPIGFAPELAPVAGYWRARIYAAVGDTARALGILKEAIDTQREGGIRDVSLLDAFIRLVFTAGARHAYLTSAELYKELLTYLDFPLSANERAVIERHVSQMQFLLEEPWRSRIIQSSHTDRVQLRKGAGASLAAWWNREDPLPATRWNERLIEHLERVATAEKRFAYSRTSTGWDDRGEIYVRLGNPTRESVLTSDALMRIFSHEAAFIPANLVWDYPQHGSYGQFIFAREGSYRLIRTTTDLLPTTLRFPNRTTGFPQRSALMTIGLEDIFSQLASQNPYFISRWAKLAAYRDSIKIAASEAGTSVERLLTNSGVTIYGHVPQFPGLPIELFGEIRTEDLRFGIRREESVPRVGSSLFKTQLLPITAQVARFLNDDGSTRAEIYWSVSERALEIPAETTFELLQAGRIPGDEFLLRTHAIEAASDYSVRQVRKKVERIGLGNEPTVFVAAVSSTQTNFNLALQVDQYTDAENPAFIRSGTFRKDSLSSLQSDPRLLEMSDLVLVSNRSRRGQILLPLTAPEISSTDSLGILFEIYHLGFGSDDPTQYRLDYRVRRRQSPHGIRRLFEKDSDVVVSGSSESRGRSSRTEEFIVLELGELEPGTRLEIEIQVTDLITGGRESRWTSVDVTGITEKRALSGSLR